MDEGELVEGLEVVWCDERNAGESWGCGLWCNADEGGMLGGSWTWGCGVMLMREMLEGSWGFGVMLMREMLEGFWGFGVMLMGERCWRGLGGCND